VRVFLSISGPDPAWVIGKLGVEIRASLRNLGVDASYGPPEEYDDQEIVYHLGYLYAEPEERAALNAVLITHIDDRLKELEMRQIAKIFDLIICISADDKNYLLELGLTADKIEALVLPVFDSQADPHSIGIMSGCYSDGRKNEKWLLEYCETRDTRGILNFVFIGPRWGELCESLEELDVSFEWHRTSLFNESELRFQRAKLRSLDTYYYAGFDGGALGCFDALSFGVPMLISNQSFHMELPEPKTLFDNKDQFFASLDAICDRHEQISFFLNSNTANDYAAKLAQIFSRKNGHASYEVKGTKSPEKALAEDRNKIMIRRGRHQHLTLKRVIGSMWRLLWRLLSRSAGKHKP
jgi:hypothetical protein